MHLIPLPAFSDNYLWLWHDGQSAVVVDPGEAAHVREALLRHGLSLVAILVTHHHADHVGGVAELRQATGARVYGPAAEAIPEPSQPCQQGDVLHLLGQPVQVLEVPGHTAGHVAYWLPQAPGGPVLFCGDTLFSGGCGRVFEGTPAQMLASLDALAALPDDTRVCCAHEYTLSNLQFALAVEPDNPDLTQYAAECVTMRSRNEPTLPARLARERAINPFLRVREPAVMAAARRHQPEAQDDVAVFAALRQWKNNFR
jgi:hydroxyacylglutathione hydrolase